ncbi:maleylpyruvate isomerase N-terminal domain-containing protein [Mycolicibacterium thermoresistibile]
MNRVRLDESTLVPALADAWDRWAGRCAELTAAQWRTPTRCTPWDVHALTAHLCPDPSMFDTLADARVDGPPAVDDAAEVLRRFNAADGIAHTLADDLADRAVADAQQLSPQTLVARFTDSAARLRDKPHRLETVIAYPAIGSTTLAVVTELALMEATVHLLDLAAAVGGVTPDAVALRATRDLLIAVPDPTAAVEALAGRTPAASVLPAIR